MWGCALSQLGTVCLGDSCSLTNRGQTVLGPGWPGGIICLIIFSWLTLYTSQLLADCHIVNGKRQRTYIDTVEAVMGRKHGIIIAW